MANEIQWRGTETGVTLYATIRSATGTQWNTAGTPNFEAVTAANWTDYDIALAETTGNYFYTGTFPAISGNMVAGWYWVDIFKRAGGSPAITDTLQGTVIGYWNGTSLLPWGTQLAPITHTSAVIPTVTTTTTATNLTNDLGKYANGAVWIDSVNGAAGTASYTNGIMSNPVTTLADAKTIADNLKMKRFWIQSGSSLTLGAAYDGYIFDGHGYTLALGGRSIIGATIRGCENLSGTATSATGECFVWNCQLGTCSFGEVDFHDCHLMGTITQSQASVPYLYDACIGVSAAKITFAAASQTAVMGNFGGSVTIAGMVSTNTLYIDGDCVVTIDNTNNAGTVYCSGNVRLTNNGTSMTIYYDNNTTKSNSLTFTVAGDLDVNVQSWAGASVATPSIAGVPEVDLTYINGVAASGSSTIDANVVSVSGDTVAADNLELAFDGTGYAGGAIKQNVNMYSSSTDSITGSALAADAITKISHGVFEEDTSHGNIGTYGYLINALAGDVGGLVTTIGVAGAGLTAISVDAASVADAVWNELETGHLDAGKAGAQLWTVLNGMTSTTINITTNTTTIDSE